MDAGDPDDLVYDELFEPLALALGRMVLGAAVLEKTLLVEVIHRRVGRDGPDEVFGEQLVSRLEQQPAGSLLKKLRQLGFQEDLAEEIAEAIEGRNHFVHHLFEDPEFLHAFASRENVDRVAERVEALTERIYRLVGKLAPGMISGAETMFGRSGPELLQEVKQIDPDEIDDDEMRRQLEALQGFPDDLMDR